MKNPLTQERLQTLQDKAVELLKAFGVAFLKNYGLILLEKATANLETNNNEKWKLQYREQPFEVGQSKQTGSNSCECFLTTSDGPGAFDGWRKVFVIAQDDDSIYIYKDEKAHTDGKKPMYKIHPAGYQAVTNVSQHYIDAISSIAAVFGMTPEEVREAADFSPYSWALVHPQRKNYVFQLHKPIPKPKCKCFSSGGMLNFESSEGSERRDDVLANSAWMQACVTISDDKCNATQQTTRLAFRKTCEQMPEKVDALRGWKDNGTEPEILIDLLLVALLPIIRDPVLEELKQLAVPVVGISVPSSVKLQVWNKALGTIMHLLETILSPAWEGIQKGAQQLDSKIEEVITAGLAKIQGIKSNIELKIKDKLGSKCNSGLDSHVTPFIQPIIDAYEEPLKQSFELGRRVLIAELELEKIPKDSEQRQSYLVDVVKRADIKQFKQSTEALVAPLESLKQLKPEIFQQLDPYKLRKDAEQMLLWTLDAVPYTLWKRLEKNELLTEDLIQQLLHGYDADAVVQRSDFVRKSAEQLLVPPFKKTVEPVIREVVDALNGVIPEEVKDFLDIEAIMTAFLEKLVGLAIDKALKAVCHVTTDDGPVLVPSTQQSAQTEKAEDQRPSVQTTSTAQQQPEQEQQRSIGTANVTEFQTVETQSQAVEMRRKPYPVEEMEHRRNAIRISNAQGNIGADKPLPPIDYDGLEPEGIFVSMQTSNVEIQHQLELLRDARRRLNNLTSRISSHA